MVLNILCIYQSWVEINPGFTCSPLRQIVQGTFRSLGPRCQPSTKMTKVDTVIKPLHLWSRHQLERRVCRWRSCKSPVADACLRKGDDPFDVSPKSWNLPSPLGSSHCSGVFVGFWIPEIPHLSTPKEVQALGEPEEWHRWPSRVNPRNTLQMANKGECSVPIFDYQRLVGMQWRQWWYLTPRCRARTYQEKLR